MRFFAPILHQMSGFFGEDDVDPPTRIDIDELYERKRQSDLATLAIYKKVLARVHARIKAVSRQRGAEEWLWYAIPEHMLGVPRYDHAACVAWVISQLNQNGFKTQYTHPNLLLISWKHHVPRYVRHQFKIATGNAVDAAGAPVANAAKPEKPPVQKKARFRDIRDFTPSGWTKKDD